MRRGRGNLHPHRPWKAAPLRLHQEKKKEGLAEGALPNREALGRSRGGLTTKLHLAADGRGRPLALHVTEGQRHDSTQLETVLQLIRVPRPCGRPRQRPEQVCLDKGYSYPRCRQLLRRKHLRHVIPERKDQREQRRQKGRQGGRPPRFEATVYRERNWVERGINRLKQWRRVATRYEKRAANYLGMTLLAAIRLWLLP
jgi:transposase